jgi:hypothetical protein
MQVLESAMLMAALFYQSNSSQTPMTHQGSGGNKSHVVLEVKIVFLMQKYIKIIRQD